MAETPTRIDVKAGTVLTLDVLRWNEGWDFDCPVCILRPVVRFSPNGESADQIVEDECINAAVDGFLGIDETEGGLVDRQFPFKALKRRWAQARAGKTFPQRGYVASRFSVRFFERDGELEFEAKEVPPATPPTAAPPEKP